MKIDKIYFSHLLTTMLLLNFFFNCIKQVKHSTPPGSELEVNQHSIDMAPRRGVASLKFHFSNYI